MTKLKQSNESISKKGCLVQTMDQPISNIPMGAMAPTTATAATARTTMGEINNLDPDLALHTNKTQHLVRLAINVKRKITSKVTATKGNVMTHQ